MGLVEKIIHICLKQFVIYSEFFSFMLQGRGSDQILTDDSSTHCFYWGCPFDLLCQIVRCPRTGNCFIQVIKLFRLHQHGGINHNGVPQCVTKESQSQCVILVCRDICYSCFDFYDRIICCVLWWFVVVFWIHLPGSYPNVLGWAIMKIYDLIFPSV